MLKNILNFEGVTLLSKEQQKSVNGGEGTCAYFLGTDGDGAPIGQFNVSMAEAQAATSNGGNWCCDSCSTAKWYKKYFIY